MCHKRLHSILAQLIVIVPTIALLFAAVCAMAASAAENDELKFEDVTDITVTLSADSTELTKTLTLRNNSSQTATVELSSIMLDADNKVVDAQVKVMDKDNKRQDTTMLAAGHAAPITAVLTLNEPFKLPLSGHLFAASKDGQLSPASRSLKITSSPPVAWALPSSVPNPLDAGTTTAVVSFLTAALILLVLRLLWLPRRITNLRGRKYVLNGLPDWSASRSFVSNFTVISGILGTILSAGLLPETTVHLDKSGYVLLSIFFAALLIIGPVIFNMNLDKMRSQDDPTKLETYGRISALLVTTGFVLWALLGEIATMSLIMDELRVGTVLPESFIFMFLGFLVLATLLLVVYIFRTLHKVIGEGKDPDAKDAVPTQQTLLQKAIDIIRALGRDEDAELLQNANQYMAYSDQALIPEQQVTRQKWPLF